MNTSKTTDWRTDTLLKTAQRFIESGGELRSPALRIVPDSHKLSYDEISENQEDFIWSDLSFEKSRDVFRWHSDNGHYDENHKYSSLELARLGNADFFYGLPSDHPGVSVYLWSRHTVIDRAAGEFIKLATVAADLTLPTCKAICRSDKSHLQWCEMLVSQFPDAGDWFQKSIPDVFRLSADLCEKIAGELGNSSPHTIQSPRTNSENRRHTSEDLRLLLQCFLTQHHQKEGNTPLKNKEVAERLEWSESKATRAFKALFPQGGYKVYVDAYASDEINGVMTLLSDGSDFADGIVFPVELNDL